MSTKQQNLDKADYLDRLQKEYICAELRSKIHTLPKYQDYYLKVMAGKKQRIETVSKQLDSPNIFTSKHSSDFYKNQIYGKSGLPNFLYRDEKHKEEQREKDIRFYYKKGETVQIIDEGRTFLAKIVTVNLEAEIIEVEGRLENKEKFGVFTFDQATRKL